MEEGGTVGRWWWSPWPSPHCGFGRRMWEVPISFTPGFYCPVLLGRDPVLPNLSENSVPSPSIKDNRNQPQLLCRTKFVSYLEVYHNKLSFHTLKFDCNLFLGSMLQEFEFPYWQRGLRVVTSHTGSFCLLL